MKLYRISFRADRPLVDEVLGFRRGVVYAESALAPLDEPSGVRLTKRFGITREHVGDLPNDMPARPTLEDVQSFCGAWIAFAIDSDIAESIYDPASRYRIALYEIRTAVESMPDAPAPPAKRQISFLGNSIHREVANELKRWRDWIAALVERTNRVAEEAEKARMVENAAKAEPELPPDGAKVSEKDVPAAFRERGKGKAGGEILTTNYLKKSPNWELKGPYLNKHFKSKDLTRRIAVGKQASEGQVGNRAEYDGRESGPGRSRRLDQSLGITESPQPRTTAQAVGDIAMRNRSKSVFVVNEPTRSCCGRSAGNCTCRGTPNRATDRGRETNNLTADDYLSANGGSDEWSTADEDDILCPRQTV